MVIIPNKETSKKLTSEEMNNIMKPAMDRIKELSEVTNQQNIEFKEKFKEKEKQDCERVSIFANYKDPTLEVNKQILKQLKTPEHKTWVFWLGLIGTVVGIGALILSIIVL
jgi:hypothetical protein